ncbi:MAG: hypothetical protein CR981_04755 [Proteobacteria bacterium]|nr:MAG: hypothetical protein CR981_04755 [Pseudomonadota bacterium]PIE65295.1 MAG: hypothetical protein CSA26_04295 [Desulfobacterales bacterium]
MSERFRTDRLLVVFFGMTAVGKSALAQAWAQRTRCLYYNTDVIRKELDEAAADSSRNAELGQGLYSREFTRKTYDTLLERAAAAFKAGSRLVILDGSYGSADERRKVITTFSRIARICFIYCYCAEETVKKRLLQRQKDPSAVSDGRWDVYMMQKKTFSLPDRLDGADLFTLDTTADLAVLCAEVDALIA